MPIQLVSLCLFLLRSRDLQCPFHLYPPVSIPNGYSVRPLTPIQLLSLSVNSTKGLHCLSHLRPSLSIPLETLSVSSTWDILSVYSTWDILSAYSTWDPWDDILRHTVQSPRPGQANCQPMPRHKTTSTGKWCDKKKIKLFAWFNSNRAQSHLSITSNYIIWPYWCYR